MLRPSIIFLTCYICGFFFLLGTGCTTHQSKQVMTPLIPLEDFFRNPERSGFVLSPNGKYLAYLAPYENRRNVFVQTIGDTNSQRITNVTDRDLAGLAWAGDERLVYMRDFGGDENYHLFSVNRDGSGDKDLTPYPNVRVELIDELEHDETKMLVGMNKRNPQIFDPYLLDLQTGEAQLLAENPGNISAWITDHAGKLRAAVSTDGVNNTLLYRADTNQPFKEVLTTNFKQSVSPLYFDFKEASVVYALSNIGRDKLAVVRLDLATGKELELIYEHPEVDVSFMSYSKKRQTPTTISFVTHKRAYKFVDKQAADLYEHLSKKLPGLETVLSSANKDEDKFIVRTYSDRSLGAYYFYDSQNDRLEKLAEVSPWLQPEQLAEMRPIQYQTKDGLTIHGYLTLPKGKENAKNLPVVINPHGGPWHRDVWGFNPEIQFLANRGYAVLQMNFRGSTGYGRKFWEASFQQWGLKMQDDISEGVAWLIAQGIADAKKIAIYGGSYGGYATLAGITFTPDLYACAVDYVGVSNLFSFLETIPPYWELYRAMLHEMVGNPSVEADSIRFRATSPVFHVDKIKAPLFIAQGAKDPRVNQAESDQMVEALRKRGVEVEYMLKTNEGHGFHNQENRYEFYTAMEAFLAKHLK